MDSYFLAEDEITEILKSFLGLYNPAQNRNLLNKAMLVRHVLRQLCKWAFVYILGTVVCPEGSTYNSIHDNLNTQKYCGLIHDS